MRAAAKREEGIGLVELLVSMMLLGLVLVMVTGLFISTTKSVAQAQAINDSSRVAANAANELSRVIRVGDTLGVSGSQVPRPAFSFAGRESLILYSNIDVNASASIAVRAAQPTLVQFTLTPSGRQLVESRWTATAAGRFWTFPAVTTTPQVTRNLGGPFTVPSSADTALFSYFDNKSLPIPAPATGSMSEADRKRIAAVRITVEIASPGSGRSSTVTNTIVLANL